VAYLDETFAGSEDPLSESGRWTSNAYPNNNKLKKIGGVVCGITCIGPPYDAYAKLAGFAINVTVEGTVRIDPGIGNGQFELECWHRVIDNGTFVQFYECNIAFIVTAGVMGAGLLSFSRTLIDGSNSAVGPSADIIIDGTNNGLVNNGDRFKAVCYGGTAPKIDLYWNGVYQITLDDSTDANRLVDGQPGLATFRRPGVDDTFDNSTGFTRVVVDDGLGSGAVMLGQGVM